MNFWLDLMRESVGADILFFQAGLVRQDMYQDFTETVALSQLFMLEEFPWGDEDPDARSSLFLFNVSAERLVTITLPFVARKYWCRAPFNDANRIHVSGFIVEMDNSEGCDDPSRNTSPIRSITFVGGCHQAGALEDVTSRCCTSPLCGRLWTGSSWDARVTAGMKAEGLRVATGQFCVPSKYGSHGQGFHEAGMLCSGAELPANWGSGADFARAFRGEGPLDVSGWPSAADDWQRLGIFFKPAMLSMLKRRALPLAVGDDPVESCSKVEQLYSSSAFANRCRCELRAREEQCSRTGEFNAFPRFFAAAPDSF